MRWSGARLGAGVVLLACLASIAPTSLASAAEAEGDDWVLERRTTTLSAADHLKIVNLHGNVTIRVWHEPGIEVIENLQRHSDDPRRWTLEVDAEAQPEGAVVSVGEAVPLSSPDPAPDGWRKRRVDLSVFVPPNCTLAIETRLGDVNGKSLRAPADIVSGGGSIKVLTDHPVAARSAYGNIEVHLERADWDGTLRFQTVTGSIDVYLPPGAVVEGWLESPGRLSSDYSMEVEWSAETFEKTAHIPSTVEGTAPERAVELISRRGDLGLMRSDSALVAERLESPGKPTVKD